MFCLHLSRLKCKTGLLILLVANLCLILIMVLYANISKQTSKSEQNGNQQFKRDYIDITELSYKIENQFLTDPMEQDFNTSVHSSSKGNMKQKYCNIYKGTQKEIINNTDCVPFKTRHGIHSICVFDPKEDRMISSYIRDFSTWEPDLLEIIGDILEKNPNLQFLDLGCNIGAFTIYVAALGRRVIAVDIIPSALDKLHKSLKFDNLEENVTLLLNAVSNARESFKVNIVPDNYGGSHVIKRNKSPVKADDIFVSGIVMDDILEVLNFGDLFIKMDIEGTEWKALEKSKEFFQIVNVRFLLMEWMLHKGKKSGQQIINYLVRNGFFPYLDYNRRELLKIERSSFWPDNVLWAKR